MTECGGAWAAMSRSALRTRTSLLLPAMPPCRSGWVTGVVTLYVCMYVYVYIVYYTHTHTHTQ